MKKIALFFLISFTVLSAASCSSSDMNKSSVEPALSQDMLFEDIESLNEFLNNKNTRSVNDNIPVFDVVIDLDTSEFCDLRLTGNNICYRYVLNDFDYSDVYVSAGQFDSNESYLEIDQNNAGHEISSSVSSSVVSDEFHSEVDFYEEIKKTITVGWNYTGNGEDGLQYFIENNPDNVFPVNGYDGLYYSDSIDESGVVVAKMLYWVQDGCYFSASVPFDYVNYMIEKIYADNPLAKRYY